MKILVIVPRVVQRFLSQLPEVTNNAYPYFNYDHRVVNERVNRGDMPSQYKGPDQFADRDYEPLVAYAKTKLNPILMKYSPRVAAEDALNIAIRSFGNGQFDGKVNANKFDLLMQAMLSTPAVVMAKKKETKPEPKPISRKVLKELGVKPKDVATRFVRRTPHLLKTDKGVVLHSEK